MIKYLIIINIISFILYFINYLLYQYANKNIDSVITILCFIFGSIGIFIAYLIFDRDFKKPVLMSRVFLFSIFIVQMITLIWVFDFKSWFSILKIVRSYNLIYYLLIINVITFILFGIDKHKSIHRKKRISNAMLLFCSFIGGSIGALCAMQLFKHKVKKDYYSVGLKYIMLMQIFILLLILTI